MQKPSTHTRDHLLSGLTGVLMLISLYAIFIYAPVSQDPRSGGVAQKIFYLHLPLALLCFLAFFVVFAASLAYLYTRADSWDRLASSAAEVGVVFCTLVLLTGSIWAKSTWNVWWTWDPRLTTVLLLWCMYVAYLLLRAMLPPGSQSLNIAAVFGMISFVNVPLTFLAIRFWRTIHPVVIDTEGVHIVPRMQHALALSFVSVSLLFVMLLRVRMRIEHTRRALRELEQIAQEAQETPVVI